MHRVLVIDEHHVLPVPFTGTTQLAMHTRVYGPLEYGYIEQFV